MTDTTTATETFAERVTRELEEVTRSVLFEERPFMQQFAQGRIPREKLVPFATCTRSRSTSSSGSSPPSTRTPRRATCAS